MSLMLVLRTNQRVPQDGWTQDKYMEKMVWHSHKKRKEAHSACWIADPDQE